MGIQSYTHYNMQTRWEPAISGADIGRPTARGERTGGHLALDFANTISWRRTDHSIEYLPDYNALLAWARRIGRLSADEVRRLGNQAARHPELGGRALAAARELREAIHQLGAALATHQKPSASALGVVHLARVRALAAARLVPGQRGATLAWDAEAAGLDRPWFSVAVAAAELLQSPELARLRMCEGRDCAWLFLDCSRNRSRRWCAPGDCGNRERVRRFHERRRRSARR